MRDTYREKIEPIFKEKCFVCHSSTTKPPWYYRIPGSNRTIKKARKHIDFAGGFPFRGRGTTQERMQELAKSIQERSMPPFMRRMTSPGSKISVEEQAIILTWLNVKLPLSRTTQGTAE